MRLEWLVNENLLDAARSGDLSEVNRLIAKGAKVNTKNDEGFTPLVIASQQGHKEIVQVLLEKSVEAKITLIKQQCVIIGAVLGVGLLLLIQDVFHPFPSLPTIGPDDIDTYDLLVYLAYGAVAGAIGAGVGKLTGLILSSIYRITNFL